MNNDIYFVIEQFMGGNVWREREVGLTSFETTVRDILSGQIAKPLMVIQVNIAEGTSRDVTEDVARAVRDRADFLTDSQRDFVEEHCGIALGSVA